MKKPRLMAISVAIMILGFALLVPPLMAAEMDYLMMSGGKMMVVHNSELVRPIDHEMTMSNGARVEPDGTVTMKDGTVLHLKNGQMIMMNGHVMNGGKATRMHR